MAGGKSRPLQHGTWYLHAVSPEGELCVRLGLFWLIALQTISKTGGGGRSKVKCKGGEHVLACVWGESMQILQQLIQARNDRCRPTGIAAGAAACKSVGC